MEKQKVKKSSDIVMTVGLDEQNVPVKLEWRAEDDPNKNKSKECKAMLLSIFDKATKDTMKIDLWTKEMQIQEMDRFFFQTFRGMADSYLRATNNKELAEDMQRFALYFGEQTSILEKK